MSLPKQKYDDIPIAQYSRNVYIITKPGVHPLEQYEQYQRRRRNVADGGIMRPGSRGGGGSMFDEFKLTDWLGIIVAPFLLLAAYFFWYVPTYGTPAPTPTAIVQQVEVVVTATPEPVAAQAIPTNLAPPVAMIDPAKVEATQTTREEISRTTQNMGTWDSKKPVQFITFSYQQTGNYPVCLKAGIVAIAANGQPFYVYLGPEISLAGQNPNNRQARVQGDFLKDKDCVMDIFYPSYLEFLGAEQPMVTPVAALAIGGPISYSTVITEGGITRTVYYTSSFTPGRSYVPVAPSQIANFTPPASAYRPITSTPVVTTTSFLGELVPFYAPSCNTSFALKLKEIVYPMEFQSPSLAPRTFNEKQALVFGTFKMVCGQMGLYVNTATYTSDAQQAGAAVAAIVQHQDTGGFIYIPPTNTPIPTATATPRSIYVTGRFINTASQCDGTNLAIEGDGGRFYYILPVEYNPNNVRERAYISGILMDGDKYDCPDDVIVSAKITWIEPTSTPTVAPTLTPTATVTLTPTATVTLTPTETVTPMPTETVTPMPTETVTPMPTETVTPMPTETVTPMPTETATVAPMPTETATVAPMPTETVK